MRGKAIIVIDDAGYLRITPAHAGKRIFAHANEHIVGDHPRACGEKTKKVQKNQRTYAAHSSNFIQFLVHSKGQAAVC